jgi:hypothetical protein
VKGVGAVQEGSAAYYLLSVMDTPGTAPVLEERAWDQFEKQLALRSSPELTGSMGGLLRSRLVEVIGKVNDANVYARTLDGELALARVVTRGWTRGEEGGARVVRCVSVVVVPGQDAHAGVTTQLVDKRGNNIGHAVTRSFADFRARYLTGGKHEE